MNMPPLETFVDFDLSGYHFPMIAIYSNPTDFPGLYIARLWDAGPNQKTEASDNYASADTLEAIRAKIPPHLNRINRFEQDDPKIVEVWL